MMIFGCKMMTIPVLILVLTKLLKNKREGNIQICKWLLKLHSRWSGVTRPAKYQWQMWSYNWQENVQQMLDMGWDPCSTGGYTICCRGVRNNHLKFIQLITNWSQAGWLRGDWRLSRPLATRSRDLCGLHSERQSAIINNFSNNLSLFKYYNIYISSLSLSLLVKLYCKHLVDFLSSSLRRRSEDQKFSNLNKIRLQLPVFALATVNRQSWTNNGSFVVFHEGRARE